MINYVQLLKDQKLYNKYNIDNLNKYSTKISTSMLSPVKSLWATTFWISICEVFLISNIKFFIILL